MPTTIRLHCGSSIASRSLGWPGFAVVALLACSGQSDPIIPDHFQVVAGAGQSGHPYQPLADSLVVVLLDLNGSPVPNYPLAWNVLSGGGTLTPAGPASDANGRAAAYWLLGGLGGVQTATVSAGPGIIGNFVAQAIPLVPDHINVIAGNGQTGPVGVPLETPLKLEVLDVNDQPIPDVRVSWNVSSGGGSIPASTSNTDLTGEAQMVWTLGPTVGAQAVTATVSGLAPITFTATGTP